MILSIHIPKTGGSSFGEILKGVYGDKLWVNYDSQWNSKTSIHASIPKEAECLHGHIEFNAFDNVYPESSKITWLRDPVERTISLYNHILNRPDRENELIMEIYQNRPSLVEFSMIPWVSNQAMNYLRCAQPNDFKFIGFLEHFEESLGLCAEILNWERVPRPVWINREKQKKTLTLSEEDTKSIRENNSEEYEWRKEAKKLFLDGVKCRVHFR